MMNKTAEIEMVRFMHGLLGARHVAYVTSSGSPPPLSTVVGGLVWRLSGFIGTSLQ
jgi:hypothetical protein